MNGGYETQMRYDRSWPIADASDELKSTRCCLACCGKPPFADLAERPKTRHFVELSFREPRLAKARIKVLFGKANEVGIY